jgi:hypothetical protein
MKWFLVILCLVSGLDAKAKAADIRWNAVDLDGNKISDAVIDVISRGVIVTSSGASAGSGLNTLSFDSSRLNGIDSPVTLRFRAIGREQASLVNMLGSSDQAVSVVLPKVFAAPEKPGIWQCNPCWPQYSPPRCRLFRHGR